MICAPTGVNRAEGGHRLLRDQRDLGARGWRASARHGAAQLAQSMVSSSAAGARAAIQTVSRRCSMRPGRVDQLQDRPHRHALAAAAFADDSAPRGRA